MKYSFAFDKGDSAKVQHLIIYIRHMQLKIYFSGTLKAPHMHNIATE